MPINSKDRATNVKVTKKLSRGTKMINIMRGKATVKLTTEQIMSLTRKR